MGVFFDIALIPPTLSISFDYQRFEHFGHSPLIT